MEILAFIRISDGRIFHRTWDGKFAIEITLKGITQSTSYTEERLSIKEFVPVIKEEYIDFYSDYFRLCGKNSDYIPECEYCGMSYYNCLCSHEE